MHVGAPMSGVLQVTDGCGTGGAGGVEELAGGGVDTDGKPVRRVKVGVGVVLVGVGVLGTLAVLTPPVIIWVVAIGRFGFAAR